MPAVRPSDRLDMTSRGSRLTRSVIPTVVLVMLLAGACTKPRSIESPTSTPVTFADKVEWILRLENQRVLRNVPNMPPTADPALTAIGSDRTSGVSLRSQPDLVTLLSDPEPQLRRRAALAIGRVGLPEGVEPLMAALSDSELEVRQMSAFALGLIGSSSAGDALVAALSDPEPLVRGRASEALGRIGLVGSAPSISAMVQRHVSDTFDLDPEDQTHPLLPGAEAFRLGLYALAELGDYELIADVVLQENGRPILWWWPVAYALQRTGDPRAAVALTMLAGVQGSLGVAFAAQGLGALGDASAVDTLTGLLDLDRRDEHVVASAVRALGRIDDSRAAVALRKFILTRDLVPTLRVEALEALSAQTNADATDLFVELMTDRWSPMRAAALRGLARSNPDVFMLVLSGLGDDRDWRVRAALADGLAHATADVATFRLRRLLEDEDQRVISHALRALVSHHVPEAESVLIAQLEREDVVVRKTAALLLGEFGSSLSLAVPDALARAYERARADSAYLARAAIVEALTQIGGPVAEDILKAALNDADWAVRVKAATGLRARKADAAANDVIRPAPGRNSVDFSAPHLVRPTVSPRVYLDTERGMVELELNVIDAPVTADNFAVLARRGFYDGLTFHRVVPYCIVQGGDPRHDTEGGPGYTLRDELNQVPFLRGTVGMVRDWPDTSGSQFFIALSPQPHLDGRYTAFAKVVSGMDIVDELRQGDAIRRVLVWDGTGPFRD